MPKIAGVHVIFPFRSGKIEPVEMECWMLNPGLDHQKPLIYIFLR